MKKIIIAIVAAALFVPSAAFAQVSTGQINALLNEDASALLALNGPDAVRQHFENILLLLTQQTTNVNPFTNFTNSNNNTSFFDGNRSPFNNFNGSFGSSNNNNDEEPDVDTERATDIEDDEAELNGFVDMNDFNNGIVFFAYGEDEDEVEDVEDEDEFNDIREQGDDLQVRRVDSDLDGRDDFSTVIRNLDEDEDYYFTICVEYEDEDDDETIDCGSVEDFTTDDRNGSSNNNNDDEPDVDTERATDIEDDEAELNGSVDMNDFSNGLVFFAYGEDESDVEDVEDEDEFDDIDERGDDLQVQRVDSDLDGSRDFSFTIRDLNDDTDYYFTICVEYEDEDDDETIDCGDIEDFRTDDRNGSNNNNDDEPEADTLSADDIEDNEARLRGEIDLNDSDEVEYYFEYGEDEDDLDERTDLRETTRDGIVSERVTGLDEDTRYFFRLVIEDTDTGEEDEGSIRNFRTDD